MKKDVNIFIKTLKKCWYKVSFKDKGLIVIMIILLLQCFHNLYTTELLQMNYTTINIVIRTSVASIFGYFLSSSFLEQIKYNKDLEEYDKNVEDIDILREKEERLLNSNKKNYKLNKEYKERISCNKGLQNAIAILVCIIIIIFFIIGVDFRFIKNESEATISQIRDLLSVSIGFLIGNRKSDENGCK